MGCKTSGGRLFCNDRSGAETARHPGNVCSATTEAERRPWTHGAPATQQPKPCGRWVARRPGDVCSATTGAERRPQDIRRMSALRRPKRSGDRKTSGGCLLCADRSGAETLDPWGQGPLPLLKSKRAKP